MMQPLSLRWSAGQPADDHVLNRQSELAIRRSFRLLQLPMYPHDVRRADLAPGPQAADPLG